MTEPGDHSKCTLDLQHLATLLEARQWDEAHRLLKDSEAWEWVMDTIPVLAARLTVNPLPREDLHALGKLLNLLASEGSPREVVMALLESSYGCHEDQLLIALLHPLQLALLRMSAKRHKILQWVLSDLYAHVKYFAQPIYNVINEELQKPPSERNQEALDDKINQSLSFVFPFIEFFNPFLDELNSIKSSEEQRVEEMRIILNHLLLLLFHPLAYFDLRAKRGSAANIARRCAETIVTAYLGTIIENIVIFFRTHWKDKYPKNQPNDDESDLEPSPISLGNLAYLVWCENLLVLPSIFTHSYLLELLLPWDLKLLNDSNYFILQKGLDLATRLLGPIGVEHLSSIYLDKDDFLSLPKTLFSIMKFCPHLEHRTHARGLLYDYFEKFEAEGRYNLLIALFQSNDHPGTKGFLIQLYKNMYHRGRGAGPFAQRGLSNFLHLIMQVPELRGYQLLECSDWILETLNFVRYLLLAKDKPLDTCEDATVLKELTTFVSTTAHAVKEAKRHFQVQLREMEKSQPDKTVSILELKTGQNYLDLMDCVVERVLHFMEKKS